MSRRGPGFGIAALLVILLAGCNQPEVVTALDRTFHLGVGRQAVLQTERVEIGFGRVTADSRCPEGAQCVWAGEARVAMWLGPEGKTPQPFEIRVSASSNVDSAGIADVGGYRVRVLQLEPHPKAGVTTDSTAYVVTVRISSL